MTDEQFVYNQDIKERKSMRTGAFHKRNGSKSKKCTMPSDYMTRKEKNKMNSECVSISMDKPMANFKQFKSLSIPVQQQYLQNVVDRYGARKSDFLTMFGISYTTFTNYIADKGLEVRFGNAKKKYPDKRFLKFVGQKTEPIAGTILTSEEEKQETISSETIKKCFGADISVKDPEPKDSIQSKPIEFETEENSFDQQEAKYPIRTPKDNEDFTLRMAEKNGEATAIYLKTLYNNLIEFNFSEDFAKSIILERAKSRSIY